MKLTPLFAALLAALALDAHAGNIYIRASDYDVGTDVRNIIPGMRIDNIAQDTGAVLPTTPVVVFDLNDAGVCTGAECYQKVLSSFGGYRGSPYPYGRFGSHVVVTFEQRMREVRVEGISASGDGLLLFSRFLEDEEDPPPPDFAFAYVTPVAVTYLNDPDAVYWRYSGSIQLNAHQLIMMSSSSALAVTSIRAFVPHPPAVGLILLAMAAVALLPTRCAA